MDACSNCGQNETYCAGECNACYGYRRRRGQPRPAELYNRPPKNEYAGRTTCSNCGTAKRRLIRGECVTCYGYRLTHGGQPRPAELFSRPPKNEYAGLTACRTCGRGDIYSKGECVTCYRYRGTHNGQPRPAHLWGGKQREKAAAELCDCGRPATHWPEITLGAPNGSTNKHEKLPLCDTCYQDFLELEAP